MIGMVFVEGEKKMVINAGKEVWEVVCIVGKCTLESKRALWMLNPTVVILSG